MWPHARLRDKAGSFRRVHNTVLSTTYRPLVMHACLCYRGTSLIRKRPLPKGPPWGPRHRPTVGSWRGLVSYGEVPLYIRPRVSVRTE